MRSHLWYITKGMTLKDDFDVFSKKNKSQFKVRDTFLQDNTFIWKVNNHTV